MASYGICHLSVVPIRTSSTEKSEMTSQLLFGELFEVIEVKGRQWTKIRCQWDNFVGWIATNQYQPITPTEFDRFRNHFTYNLEVLQAVMSDDHYLPIPLGARLPDFDGMRFNMGTNSYTYSGQVVSPEDIEPSAEFIVKIARRYLYAPYLTGGRSPLGIDSAGFTQQVFRITGIKLPRVASEQVFLGESVDFIEQAQVGDLAFFENKAGRISHTGIILPDQKIIHSYGRVRIDNIDHYGVYCEEFNQYTHKLRVVKRHLDQSVKSSDLKATSKAGSKQVPLFDR